MSDVMGAEGGETTFGRGLRDAFTPAVTLTEREISHLFNEEPEIVAHFIKDAYDADNPELALIATGVLAAKTIDYRSQAATLEHPIYREYYQRFQTALADFLPLILPNAEQVELDVKKPQFGANPNVGLGFGLDEE